MVVADHLGVWAVFAAYGVVDDFVLKWRVQVCFAKKHLLGLVGYGFEVPFWVGYESVEAALVFFVDEEFVCAFYIVFFFAGDYESHFCSAEVLKLRLAEDGFEL